MLSAEFKMMRQVFTSVNIEFFGLTTLVAVPIRHTRLGDEAKRLLQRFDHALGCMPYLGFLYWHSLIECSKGVAPSYFESNLPTLEDS